jgi:toxin secretion/phage lysis holin
MKNFPNMIQLLITVVGGYIGWFLGGFDGFLYALLAFVVIDYLTGLMVAVLEKKLSSEVGFRGIFKKVLIFSLVGIGNMVDVYLLKNGSAIRTAVISFYLSNEGISILENTGKIGLPVPGKLKNILEQLREDENNG